MNTSAMQVFENQAFGKIRGMLIESSPWFVAKDIAVNLGYSNPQKAVKDHVYEEDLLIGKRNITPSIIDSAGRIQYPTWVNESGIYTLILGSKLPKVKEFKHWVTSEVLPAIRKTGSYSLAPKVKTEDLSIISILNSYQELLSTINSMSTKIDMLIDSVTQIKAESKATAPAVESKPVEPISITSEPETPKEGHSSLCSAMIENGVPEANPSKKHKALASQTHSSKAQSPWRHEVYELAKPTCRRIDMSVSALFSKIYKQMEAEYSWVFYEERKKFIERNGNIPNTSVIDIVEDSPMYRDIFMSILRDKYAMAKPQEAKQEVSPAPASVAAAVEEMESDAVSVTPITAAAGETRPSHCDYIAESRKLVEKLAVAMKDSSYHSAATYHYVYDAIGEAEMNRIRDSYRRSFGRPKGAIINMFNTKNRYDKLAAAVNSMIPV